MKVRIAYDESGRLVRAEDAVKDGKYGCVHDRQHSIVLVRNDRRNRDGFFLHEGSSGTDECETKSRELDKMYKASRRAVARGMRGTLFLAEDASEKRHGDEQAS